MMQFRYRHTFYENLKPSIAIYNELDTYIPYQISFLSIKSRMIIIMKYISCKAIKLVFAYTNINEHASK